MAPSFASSPRERPDLSEATRLLCVGTYVDGVFRDAVIDELYVHTERIAAPAPGVDTSLVLAHALRARRVELGWAATVVLLWLYVWLMSDGLALMLAAPLLAIGLARRLRRQGPGTFLRRTLPAFVLLWWGRVAFFSGLLALLPLATEDDDSGVRAWLAVLVPVGGQLFGYEFGTGSGYDDPYSLYVSPLEAWVSFLGPVLLAVVVALRRAQIARILAGELSAVAFAARHPSPPWLDISPRFRRVAERIRREQQGRLVLYGPGNPFCGFGEPYEPLSLSIELRPAAAGRGDGGPGPEPLGNSTVLRHVVALVEALRVPAAAVDPLSQEGVRDRLRDLEVEEVVFLPVEALLHRDQAAYGPEEFERERAQAVEEGGEARRHYLSVRVSGMHQVAVTTVFVRVHTQGGLLAVDVTPYVLRPVSRRFQEAARLAHRTRRPTPVARLVSAAGELPDVTQEAFATLARSLSLFWRLLTAGHADDLPDGPHRSVRELGADDDASLFQKSDIDRYLRSVRERVVNGVIAALRESGYETADLERESVPIARLGDGATYISNTHGTVTIGDRNRVDSRIDSRIDHRVGERETGEQDG
ncbi:hypothetical protein [Streptomyces sp. NPDC090025]|uniref:hypothetical protein n=1 Tax=Streptomyces sp. NPDC090025 TaxID=3365922 RepID=UPI00383276F6